MKKKRPLDTKQLAINLAKLPAMAWFGPEDCLPTMKGNAFVLRRGEAGYWPMSLNADQVREINSFFNVSTAQRKAMLNGSMFGWDTPAADPDNELNQERKTA